MIKLIDVLKMGIDLNWKYFLIFFLPGPRTTASFRLSTSSLTKQITDTTWCTNITPLYLCQNF